MSTHDDYEDYDRPRKKSGTSTGLIIGVVVGVALLVMCGGGALLIALLLPAISKVREAAARTSDSNNLKQIGLGMHNDHDVINQWTVPYAHDARGNVHKGLSFRVSLLPYLEQDDLYRSFDLTQPWDSARNRPFSDTVVLPYRAVYDQTPGVSTPYRAFVGGGAMFNEDGSPVRLVDVKDGTMNTIMLVHATEQVPWAQPKELPYNPNAPLPALGHASQPGGYNVLMADGSVRFVQSRTPEHVIRGLITRAGGEELPPDW
jgi:prepilin-type processing-associated H-X9-DG protein